MRRIVAVCAVAVTVLGLAFAPPAAAAVGWNTAPVVTRDVANAELDAVDCPTAGFCVAVGSGELTGGQQLAVTEVSDGGAWQRKGIPVGDAADTALHGVDCVSSTFCVAVGEYRPYDSSSDAHALAVVWNGTAWRPSSMGGPGDVPTRLRSVSCVSTTFCMAVGEREVDAGVPTPTAVNTLIDYYDGSSWRELGSVSPDRFSRLRSVSCPTTTFCVAVGTTGRAESNTDATVGLREVLTPQGWTLSTAAAPSGTSPALASPQQLTDGLYSVSCTSATFCLEAGFSDTVTGGAYTQIDRWDGTSWAGVPDSWTRNATRLTAVSCLSPTSCVLAARNGLHSITGTWDGTVAKNTGTAPVGLVGLSCRSASDCVGVGENGPKDVATYNGTTWTGVATPSINGDPGSELAAVSCVSRTWCLAVGSQFDGRGGMRNIVERWDGSQWSPATNDIDRSAQLVSISCVSKMFCVVVGLSFGDDYSVNPVVHVWNGSGWTAAALPASARWSDSISCLSTSFCLAVGYGRALVWDGTTWSASALANANFQARSVSCSSATECVAVGEVYSALHVERWDGSGWRKVSAPARPQFSIDELTAVSCISVSYCVTVGFSGYPGEVSEALLYTWNGTAWKAAVRPDTPRHLTSVSCWAVGDCVAVADDDTYRALSASDGQWVSDQVLPSNTQATSLSSSLLSVSCLASIQCVAVGSVQGPAAPVAFSSVGYFD